MANPLNPAFLEQLRKDDETPPACIAKTKPFSHYFRSVQGLEKIDAYRIIDLYQITDPCLQHALKKILCAGKRGAKSADKDVAEVIASCQRWQEMQQENAQYETGKPALTDC